MLKPPLLVFVLAAFLGVVLAAHVLRGKFAHWSLSPVHAFLGAIGLALMLTPLAQAVVPQRVWIGFGLLVLAALLGGVLAWFHVRQKMPPKPLVLVHITCAVSGLTTVGSTLW